MTHNFCTDFNKKGECLLNSAINHGFIELSKYIINLPGIDLNKPDKVLNLNRKKNHLYIMQ
jgi:hypothetical protein